MTKTPRTSLKYKSFALLYRQFGLPLMKFLVKRMGGNQEAAGEVFSQTIFAALKSWHTFQHKSSFFTWICRIGLNKMADYYRDQIHERSIIVIPALEELANIGSKDLSSDEKYALEELRMAIRDALGKLSPQQRQLLHLRYWRDQTISAIAKTLNMSERSVEGKIYRAKVALKQILMVGHTETISNYSVLPKNQPSRSKD